MIELMTEGASLDDKAIESIKKRTDGNPLFIEEVTRKLLSHSAQAYKSDAEIPGTLQNLLLDRLDQLGEAKNVAQVAATIGREFDLAMLAAIEDQQDAAVIDESVRKLIDAEIIREEGRSGGTKWIFHHALFQEAAYNSQLKSRQARFSSTRVILVKTFT